jgi:hypothetical protein
MIFTTMRVTHTHPHTQSLYRCCINICYYADTGLTTVEQWTYFGPWQKAFPFSKTSRPAVGPTQPPIQWLPGSGGGSAFHPGHGADYSFPSSAEVKNAWSYISTPSHAFVTRCLNWEQGLFLNHFRWKEDMWLGTVVCPATLPVWWRAPAHFSASRTGGKTCCRVHRVTGPDIPIPPPLPHLPGRAVSLSAKCLALERTALRNELRIGCPKSIFWSALLSREGVCWRKLEKCRDWYEWWNKGGCDGQDPQHTCRVRRKLQLERSWWEGTNWVTSEFKRPDFKTSVREKLMRRNELGDKRI